MPGPTSASSLARPARCVLLGTAATVAQVVRQLRLLDAPPLVSGAILFREEPQAVLERLHAEHGLDVLGLAAHSTISSRPATSTTPSFRSRPP